MALYALRAHVQHSSSLQLCGVDPGVASWPWRGASMTREPVPIEPAEQPVEPPQPVTTSMREPSEAFIRHLTAAIKAGASATNAAELYGVPRKKFQRWMRSRDGGACDALRTAVRAARAHFRVWAETRVAKEHPERALRLQHARDEQAEPSYSSAPRPYSKSGINVTRREMPHMLARISDDTIADADLSLLELTARDWRNTVLTEIGEATATCRALLDAAVGSYVLLQSIDHVLFEMAATAGLVSRKHRRLFPIVLERMRVADSLARQLEGLGLERAKPGATALQQYVEQNYGGDKTDARVPSTDAEQETPE